MKITIYRDMDSLSKTFILTYLILNALNSCVQDVFKISGASLSLLKNGMMVILALLIVYMIFRMDSRQRNKFFLIEILGVIPYIYSMVVGVQFSTLSAWMITTLPVCLPIMFAASEITDFDSFYESLRKVTWILLAILILNMLGGIQDNMYDMHFSYGLLLVMLIHINELLDKKIRYAVPVVFELFMLLAYGSRGALVCIAVFVVLKITSTMENLSKKIIYSFVILIVVSLLVYILNNYGYTIYLILKANGFSSRTLALILQGEFSSHDSGRFELWETVINLIKEKPITGWGIRGAVNQMGHPYPHNLFLDLFLTFGVPVGSVFSVALLWKSRKIFTFEPGRKKELTCLFFAQGFVTLMYSSTLFTSYYFFAFLGFALNRYSTQNKEKINEFVKNIK